MNKNRLRKAIASVMEVCPNRKTYRQIEIEDDGGNYTCWDVRSEKGWWVVHMDYGWATSNDMLDEPAEWEPTRKPFDKCAKLLEEKIVQDNKVAEYVTELFRIEKIPETDKMYPSHIFRAITARPTARCQAALVTLGIIDEHGRIKKRT